MTPVGVVSNLLPRHALEVEAVFSSEQATETKVVSRICDYHVRCGEAVQSAVANTFGHLDDTEPVVVLGGPANSYTHYIATTEEYSIQRYEGASTLYGPYTLDAYLNLSSKLLPCLDRTAPKLPPLDPGPSPPINVVNSLSFITGVVVDNPPFLKSFGDEKTAPKPTYRADDSISVTFVGVRQMRRR
ncbi:hypothetical protein LTR37_004441 [Vermiconidia calcicola]|uniref:Uncharacterized protein n=1 Tax=Vermiconidia calcicola TaxID=1690605 RepID=A0ACC3NNG0_9PEZI|nr:hypothetical protein LTR37_004441 [Vermiconidia calcicola]